MSVNGTAFEGINDIASSKYAGYNIKASLAEPGRIAQLAEHLLYTQGVTGSSPVSPTRKLATFAEAWCSGLTCLPVTQEIAGSTPVASANNAEVAQMVEQGTENPRVDGSIPPLGTIPWKLAEIAQR